MRVRTHVRLYGSMKQIIESMNVSHIVVWKSIQYATIHDHDDSIRDCYNVNADTVAKTLDDLGIQYRVDTLDWHIVFTIGKPR